MGKKNIIKYILFLALTLFLCTCNDPVFYAISLEVKPIPPRIKGVPTNYAVYNGCMYVASGGSLFAYNKGADDGKIYWSEEPKPGGNILQIASTGSNLYALCSTDKDNDGKTVVKRFDKDNSTWNTLGGVINDSNKVQNIYSAGGVLFISAVSSMTDFYGIYYTVLYIDNSDPETVNILKTVKPEHQNNMGEINGAAYNGKDNIYYLSAKSGGVYRIDDFDEGANLIRFKDADENEVNVNFSGIINLEDDNNTIVLITRNGNLYSVSDSISRIENVSMGKMATGALAIWRESNLPGSGRLLLSGRQDSLIYSVSYGYTYGYLELEIDENGIKSGKNFVEPGIEMLSSVRTGENERYQSTIGKQPLSYIFQVPPDIDGDMILFASTQKNGVWSYRERGGIYQWNAEE